MAKAVIIIILCTIIVALNLLSYRCYRIAKKQADEDKQAARQLMEEYSYKLKRQWENEERLIERMEEYGLDKPGFYLRENPDGATEIRLHGVPIRNVRHYTISRDVWGLVEVSLELIYGKSDADISMGGSENNEPAIQHAAHLPELPEGGKS